MLALESVQHILGLGRWVGLLVLAGAAVTAILSMVVLVQVLHWLTTLREVRQPGLWCITGLFGAGKTYFLAWVGLYCQRQRVSSVRGFRSAVADGLASRAAGKCARPVFANFALRGQAGVPWVCEVHKLADGSPDPECRRIHSWEDVRWLPWGSVLLLDESHLWWGSVEWNVDEWLEAWVSQIRKYGLSVYFNAQSWRFVSTRLRRLTMGVWEGKRVGPLSVYSLYSAQGFDSDRVKRDRRVGRLVLRRRRAVQAAYHTLEEVLPVSPPKRSRSGRSGL